MAEISIRLVQELRSVLRKHVEEFARPQIIIRNATLEQRLAERFGVPFTKRPPEYRNTDAVLIIVSEICGRMGVSLDPKGNAELRKKLNGLLGQ